MPRFYITKNCSTRSNNGSFTNSYTWTDKGFCCNPRALSYNNRTCNLLVTCRRYIMARCTKIGSLTYCNISF